VGLSSTLPERQWQQTAGVFEQRVIDGDMVVEQLGVLGCDLLFLYSFYHYGRAIGKSYDLTYHPQKRTVGR